jgi:adenylate kinase
VNQKSSILVFIGPPGAGKGTLSQHCVHQFGWVQLSTGNLCRKAMAQNNVIGREIAEVLHAGKLVPDDLVDAMVSEWLTQQLHANRTIILDGYPRARTQANTLHDFLQKNDNNELVHVIRFVTSPELLIQRLTMRLVCSKSDCQRVYSVSLDSVASCTSVCDSCGSSLVKRTDDRLDVIKERLAAYYKNECELLNFYQTVNQSVFELSANDQIDLVFKRFCTMLGISA